MATKTLTIMEDAYNLLKLQKSESESFSDVIRRICEKSNIMQVFGSCKELDADGIINEIYKNRDGVWR